MDVTEQQISTWLVHWPFVAALVVAMLFVEVIKASLFTPTAELTKKPRWFYEWGRNTLTIQPIIAGALLGLIWENPEAGISTRMGSVGYFAMAGALSVWAYEFFKGLAKKRGIELDLPGVDEPADLSEAAAEAAAAAAVATHEAASKATVAAVAAAAVAEAVKPARPPTE